MGYLHYYYLHIIDFLNSWKILMRRVEKVQRVGHGLLFTIDPSGLLAFKIMGMYTLIKI